MIRNRAGGVTNYQAFRNICDRIRFCNAERSYLIYERISIFNFGMAVDFSGGRHMCGLDGLINNGMIIEF